MKTSRLEAPHPVRPCPQRSSKSRDSGSPEVPFPTGCLRDQANQDPTTSAPSFGLSGQNQTVATDEVLWELAPRYPATGMSLLVRLILWADILLAAVGIWLLLIDHQRSRRLYAWAIAVSAAALAAVVCGLTGSLLKFTLYTVSATPIIAAVLLVGFRPDRPPKGGITA